MVNATSCPLPVGRGAARASARGVRARAICSVHASIHHARVPLDPIPLPKGEGESLGKRSGINKRTCFTAFWHVPYAFALGLWMR